MKKLRKLIFLALFFTVVALNTFAEEIKNPCPLYVGYVLGGIMDGKWVETSEIVKHIKGGEKYKVYSSKDLIGTGIGSKVVPRDLAGFIDIDLKVDYIVPQIRKTEIKNFFDYFTDEIAIGGQWNALPRLARIQNSGWATYHALIADMLIKKGFQNIPVSIRRVFRVDLEGDGVDEVLITASNIADYSDKDDNKYFYSVVLLRKIINGEVENFVLKSEFKIREEDGYGYFPGWYYTPFIIDTNGDGTMEVLVEEYYGVGRSMTVYEIKDNEVKEVLSAGFDA